MSNAELEMEYRSWCDGKAQAAKSDHKTNRKKKTKQENPK
jgi:hypothetical protein